MHLSKGTCSHFYLSVAQNKTLYQAEFIFFCHGNVLKFFHRTLFYLPCFCWEVEMTNLLLRSFFMWNSVCDITKQEVWNWILWDENSSAFCFVLPKKMTTERIYFLMTMPITPKKELKKTRGCSSKKILLTTSLIVQIPFAKLLTVSQHFNSTTNTISLSFI